MSAKLGCKKRLGSRRWTPEEDAALRELVIVGVDYRKIARRLKRTEFACRSRAHLFGMKKSSAAILENRKQGRERFRRNARKVERRMQRIMKNFTPDERAVRAEELRQRNKAGITGLKGRHHRPEVCARISAANKGKKRTDEQRQNYRDGAKRRWETWRANRPEALAKAAMQADKRHRLAVGEWGEVQPSTEALFWCRQCELRVSAQQAADCSSKWCKAKALAA